MNDEQIKYPVRVKVSGNTLQLMDAADSYILADWDTGPDGIETIRFERIAAALNATAGLNLDQINRLTTSDINKTAETLMDAVEKARNTLMGFVAIGKREAEYNALRSTMRRILNITPVVGFDRATEATPPPMDTSSPFGLGSIVKVMRAPERHLGFMGMKGTVLMCTADFVEVNFSRGDDDPAVGYFLPQDIEWVGADISD